jgi:hypothetical protein
MRYFCMRDGIGLDQTVLKVRSIAVPQRSDGVAHALHAIYDSAVAPIPRDIATLLGQLDALQPFTTRD